MIGGVEIQIPTNDGAAALGVCARMVLCAWPNAVVEDADSGHRFDSAQDFITEKTHELLIYRDEAGASAWDEQGAAPELQDTLVHLLADNDLVTIVVDDPASPEMAAILDQIRVQIARTGLEIATNRSTSPARIHT